MGEFVPHVRTDLGKVGLVGVGDFVPSDGSSSSRVITSSLSAEEERGGDDLDGTFLLELYNTSHQAGCDDEEAQQMISVVTDLEVNEVLGRLVEVASQNLQGDLKPEERCELIRFKLTWIDTLRRLATASDITEEAHQTKRAPSEVLTLAIVTTTRAKGPALIASPPQEKDASRFSLPLVPKVPGAPIIGFATQLQASNIHAPARTKMSER